MPLVDGERLIGVLDLDSPRLDRFDAGDARVLEALAQDDRRRLGLAARRHRRFASRYLRIARDARHFAREM